MPAHLKSYGVAALMVVIVALWMGTGTLVQGGQGPHKGEKPVVGLIDGGDGPLSKAVEDAGLAKGDSAKSDLGYDPALSIAERNAKQSGAEGGLPSVRIQTFTAKPMPIIISLRGQTEARATVPMVAQTSAVVTEVAVKKGQTVKTGDLLCQLDPGPRTAAVAQAQAALAQAQKAFDSNKSLRAKGLAPSNSAQSAEAGLKAAQAALDQAQAELGRTKIVAKAEGIVQEPLANVGQLLGPGGVCANIVQLNPIIFAASIPEARIGQARTGLKVDIETVAGDTAQGVVSYISSVADPATQTFRVEAEVPNPGNKIRDGLTTQAKVNVGTLPAQFLPQSVLTLNDEGVLGVRAVKDGVVQFYKIDIVNNTAEGVWVTGLPAIVDIITLGQENVKQGQKVDGQKYDPKGTAS